MTSPGHDIVVVTGLPRSGTSLCMRMLEAGGMPVLVDHARRSDDDNPSGYYEFEPVKQTQRDDSWLRAAGGKAVKMVYRLLYDLPDCYRFRVLFMRRNMQEILASQRKMLERRGSQGGLVSDTEMRQLFEKELVACASWLCSQRHFTVLEVNYNRLLESPIPVLESIDTFLDKRLDIPAMCGVIDLNLYRNRLCPAAPA